MATESRYPNWDARYDELQSQTEREIEEWYKANADRGAPAGPAPAGAAANSEAEPHFPATEGSWIERAAEEVQVLYNDVAAKLKDMFTGDDYDEATRAEHAEAWGDRGHWQSRMEQTVKRMDEQGKFRY